MCHCYKPSSTLQGAHIIPAHSSKKSNLCQQHLLVWWDQASPPCADLYYQVVATFDVVDGYTFALILFHRLSFHVGFQLTDFQVCQ